MTHLFKVNGQFSLKRLLLALLVSLGIGILSSIFTINARDIYQNLNQPSFAPPGWIFAPMWTVLYLLMGLASYRVWMVGTGNQAVREALGFYLVQLLFNFLWSVLFFGMGLHGAAFIEILVLWVLIMVTMLKFKKVDSAAFYLLVPYLLWVSFAVVLNYAVWFLNR